MIKKKTVVIFGITGLLVILAVFIYQAFFYFNSNEVGVAMSTDDVQQDFILNMKNRRIRYEYTSVEFDSPLDREELKSCIRKQFPDGKITEEGNLIQVVQDNTMIYMEQKRESSFLFWDRYRYEMHVECITLQLSSEEYICIPFPKEYLKVEGMYESSMKISCNMKQLREFYRYFTNVIFREKEMILQKEDHVVKIRIENGTVYFNIQ